MRVAKYDKVFHPDNTEQQKAFPRRLPLITSWAIPFEPGGRHGQRRGHPATSPSGSIVDECRHLGPVVPDVPGPHPVEMAGTAHGIDHRLVQRVDVGEHLLEAPAVGR
jgi:hypothetical protein